MKIVTMLLTLTALSTVSISGFAKPETPAVLPDGMELVEKDSRGEIYADPGVDWNVYTKIQLDKATVAFRKYWQRDQNRYPSTFKIKTSDMEKIKIELSELFNEVFTEELTHKNDFQMVTESGENVMRISPQIVDLDINAPDRPTAGIQRAYTNQAGRMTLKLEIYDSVTGDLIATASDRRESPNQGYMQWTNSVSNRADARRILQIWARDLRKRLDEARGASE